MNKLTRFTLFAGLLAFGLSACGDDVQVVEPTPPPPPTLVVSLQPNVQDVHAGETVVLAVNISGGATGVAPTITCTTNSANLTVATSGQTCTVTAKAGSEGTNNTVTVSVMKGDQTATAGASVNVLPDTSEPATVVIEKVTQGSLLTPVALNNVRRQVEVTVNIDPGTQLLEKVTLLFRGTEIASQTLSPAQVAEMRAAIAEDSPEAQVLRTITFSWETDAYVIDAGGAAITGSAVAIVNHANGSGDLQARLDVDDGSDQGSAVNSVPLNLTLRNANGFHLKIDRTGSTNTALDVQGFEWRGGMDGVNTNSGINAHLIPVLYTPGVTLQSAQFTFGSPTPLAGILKVVAAPGPWTYSWTAANLAGYVMPVVGVPGYPNILRDGEYPRLVGNATLSDGQGMGPFGGAVDCVGIATGILNVEISPVGLCALGTAWSPPSASLLASANDLDPLRTGERIDNAGPVGQTFALVSRPGLPDWPQIPSTPAGGAAALSAGTWVNENLNFSNTGIHSHAGRTDGLDANGAVSGVSRAVAGFPAPTFLADIFQSSSNGGATYIDISANPVGGAMGPETNTNTVYRARNMERDALDNRTTLNLTGNAGTVLMGLDAADPFLTHTAGLSNPDRFAFDLATASAGAGGVGDDLTTVAGPSYFYYVNWTDPISVGASGFTAFAGNPVWRQLHRVSAAGLAVVVGGVSGSSAVTPTWSGAGLTNYGRTGASQQPVTCNILACAGPGTANGFYIYRAYAIDDAGNASVDVLCTVNPCAQPQAGTQTWNSASIRRQSVVDGDLGDVLGVGKSTVFGITAPVVMTGGSAVTFVSNSADNLDLGQSFLSLDYVVPNTAAWWAANSTAAAPNGPMGYWTPAAFVAPTVQGTTGGIRFQGAENEEGVIFDSPFEAVATLNFTANALSRTVPFFVRSIEMVCSAAGVPIASCPAAPADWASDIAVNLVGPTPVGWFAPPGAPVNAAYAAGRPINAAFAQYDATRLDHLPVTSGHVNGVLEQVSGEDATSPQPHRGVSVASINPVSVALAGGFGTEVSPYHKDAGSGVAGPDLQNGWAISAATGSVTGSPAPQRTLNLTITARLISGSAIVAGGPGQNLFPGPLGHVQFFAFEAATGTIRYLGAQMNPVLYENNPFCVTNTMLTQASYRCWDFTNSFVLPNYVGGPGTTQVFAIGVNAAGDGLATFPVNVLTP